ncbi:TRAP transporter small permease [Novipirellula artificiosorum]|uniref:2,3-diketo-L-gulonate TRAP transporter small permease protein YiaM n=1 Tax=Novipirellula artificiosorum TaxID=2528016 RepID=A0A5C6DP52_9BACT|nr:TRAP transporter small permease [Novipirellula artificiosorum]TWU38382.1 2,3-diketo-L-gulonate TRAP transporter small permease protein YiaM [Novipirellula artificiosorum]
MRQIALKVSAGLNLLLNWLLILAMALLVLDVVWGVFTRYIVGEQANWTEELARFLLVWVAMLGGAVAFGTKGHLGVDYFVGKFDPSIRKIVALLGHVVVLFFAMTIFVLGGIRMVHDAFAMEQTTPALGWRMGYIYMVLPLAGCFMVLFTIENLIRTLRPSADPLQRSDSVEQVN